MARTTSPIFKFAGTIADLTFVNSQRYKPHTRRKKGTVTPIVLTDALIESKDRLQLCNQQARPIFQALREYRDGSFWSRLVALFFRELKAGRKISVDCLRDLECNLTHKLDELISGGYNITVKKEKKKLGIQVLLQEHPMVNDKLPRDGYQLRLVVIYPDFLKGQVRKEVVLGPLTKYDSALEAVELEVPMPSGKSPYIVLMGVCPIIRGAEMKVMSDSGMKVVAVG